jgi:hypothetical protein
MTKAIMILMLLGVIGCSSTPKTGDAETDKVLAHMRKGDFVVGKDWEQKFLQDGLIGSEVVAIGSSARSVLGANKISVANLRLMAETDARERMLLSAPSEFKRLIQKAIQSVDNDEGTVDASSVSISEVKALTGIRNNFNDFQCVKTAHPTEDLKYSYSTECRLILRVSSSELQKSYSYTLSSKYGIKEQSTISEILKKELSLNTASDQKLSGSN